MRRDVQDLRTFYGGPLGRATASVLCGKLLEAWGSVRGLDLLGLGYATPLLEPFRADARRVVAAMPAAQGVEPWPAGRPVLTALSSEAALPFQNALFDRVLLVHALEESEAVAALLEEVKRVLAPSGRLIVVVANRSGPWARTEATPFGYGRPFSRTQLEEAVRDAGLEPTAWSRCLYMPPHAAFSPYVEPFEQVGARLWTPLSGLILMEAVKQTFAVRPRGAVAPALRRRKVLAPVPIGVGARSRI